MHLLLALLLPSQLWLCAVDGSNWAQTTGLPRQNVVATSNPGPSLPHWSAREGLAVAVADSIENVSKSQAFLVGGDDGTVSNAENGGGVRNDVWSTRSGGWTIEHPTVDREDASVRSTMHWTLINAGQLPPFAVRFKEWVQCSDALVMRSNNTIGVFDPTFGIAADEVECTYDPLAQGTTNTEPKTTQLPAVWKESLMFSPRRFHQVIYHAKTLWVLGGEARDGAEMAQEKQHRRESTSSTPWREELVLKNDVWFSLDSGLHWNIANPGTDPNIFQRSFLSEFVPPDHVPESTLCTGSNGCYGSSECTRDGNLDRMCISTIWSPRKHHRAVGYGNYVFVVGGFAHIPQGVCGQHGCGNQRRIALNDVWRADLSKPWINLYWTEMKKPSASTTNSWRARGRFGFTFMNLYGSAATWAMSQISEHQETDDAEILLCLWIIGGEGDHHNTMFNDTWFTVLNMGDESASIWTEYSLAHIPWSPRAGHVVGVEPPSWQNNYLERMIIHGGNSIDEEIDGHHTFVGEQTWSWGPRCESLEEDGQTGYNGRVCTRKQMSPSWIRDYSSEAWYKLQTRRDDDSMCVLYSNGSAPGYCPEFTGPTTPQQFYVDKSTRLNELYQTFLPGSLQADFIHESTQHSKVSRRNNGEKTIRIPLFLPDEIEHMFKLPIRTVHELANADLKTVLHLRGYNSEQHIVKDICKKKALCQEIIVKCGTSTGISEIEVDIDWEHEVSLCANEGSCEWDGCTVIYESIPIEVKGFGAVKQADAFQQDNMIDEFQCKINPGERTDHAAFVLDNNFYIAGGRDGYNSLAADTFNRDDRLPSTTILKRPSSGTGDKAFEVTSDEEGIMHEYQLYDKRASHIVQRWSTFSSSDLELDILSGYNPEWVQASTQSKYIFYVRGLDPAGNSDPTFSSNKGSNLNMYTWKFTPPLPWASITTIAVGALIFVALSYQQYLKYKKADALRRYALRRLRRRMKKNSMEQDKQKNQDAHKVAKIMRISKDKEKQKYTAPSHVDQSIKVRMPTVTTTLSSTSVAPENRSQTKSRTQSAKHHYHGNESQMLPIQSSTFQNRRSSANSSRPEFDQNRKSRLQGERASASRGRAPKKTSQKIRSSSSSSTVFPNPPTKTKIRDRRRIVIESAGPSSRRQMSKKDL